MEKARLSKMIDTIMKVTEGDYSSQVEVTGENDELDSLAVGINMMIDNIRNSVKEVDRERDSINKYEKSWQVSFNSLEDIMMIIGKDYTIERVNDSFLKLTGKSQEEIIGKKCYQIVHGQESPGEYCPFRKTLKSKKIETIERHEKLFGKYFSIKSSPIFNENGEIVKFVDLMRDITESKKAENTLKERMKELQCLYSIAGISEKPGITLDELYQEVVNLLLSGWQYPEITCSRITFKGKNFESDNFRKTKWIQKANISIRTRVVGTVEVYYLEEKPDIDEGPFLQEERNLINAIAKQLGEYTERIEAEKSILESNGKLQLILDNSPIGIFHYDKYGNITMFNKAFKQFIGAKEEKIKGHNIFESNIDKKMLNAINESISGKQSIFEGEHTSGINNKKMHVRAIFTPLYSSEEKFSGGICIYEDISERIRLENLRVAKESAEKAYKVKSTFLTNMSHEIRTPLNAIIGFSDMLAKYISDELQTSYIESIHSSGKSLLNIIDDILDISQIEADRLELQYGSIDTFSLFNEMNTVFSLKIKEKGLKFILDINKNLPVALYLDETRSRQILINLIDNAIKFTEEGHVKLSVKGNNLQKDTIAGKPVEYIDLIIEVKDTGIGILKTSCERIFEPFIQQDEQTTKKYGGTGLGLSISKKLVEMMNGKLTVTSELGKGSTFKIVFKNVQISHTKIVTNEKGLISPDNIKFNEKEQEYLQAEYEISGDAIKNLPLIIKKLETEMMDEWNKFRDQQPMDKVKEFGNQLKTMGEENDIKILSDYGKNLKLAVNNVDIEKMLKLIKDFPELLQKLKTYQS